MYMKKSINSKRLIAYLLDTLFVYLLISLISSIRIINPTYEKYEESYESYSEIIESFYNEEITAEEMVKLNKDNLYDLSKYSISSNVVIIVVIFAYFGLFQKYNNGQTLGKKIMKIKVVSNNDNEVSLGRYILRILPMYYIFIGNVLAVFLNTLALFIFKSNLFIYVNAFTTYLFLIIGIISFVMMNKKQDNLGLHDILAKTKVVFE